ncbi:hypothetical protein 162286340 [Organic Lake phycodnavirus]|nr:hypothetical protein 162286340 [Organic Lake phycodnavirus]
MTIQHNIYETTLLCNQENIFEAISCICIMIIVNIPMSLLAYIARYAQHFFLSEQQKKYAKG